MSEELIEYATYRCPSSSGSKDWGIAITADNGLRTVHCATGQTVRRTDIPKSQFRDPHEECQRRTSEKTRKGYAYLGKAVIQSNRLKLVNEPATGTPTDRHRWEAVTALDRLELHRRLAWAVEQVAEDAAPETIVFDENAVVCRCTGPDLWSFGFSDDGGLHSVGRGGGVVTMRQGLLPRLMLLYLQRCFPGAIAITAGEEMLESPRISRDSPFIGEHLFDYERVLQLSSRLGLCVGPLHSLDWKDHGSRRGFWI